MDIVIAAVGRLRAGPEREIGERYLQRVNKAGRSVGLGPVRIVEMPESRAARAGERMAEEAAALLAACPAEAACIALDEAGRALGSEAFARHLGALRDEGRHSLAFLIGGADGHGDAVHRRADLLLSLSAMTWPHQIVRLLLAEQLYRAVTILSGHPYHRM